MSAAPFSFRNRKPAGAPASTGGQFTTTPRGESTVALDPRDAEVDEPVVETLDVGEWAEADGVRVRFVAVPEDVPVADDDSDSDGDYDWLYADDTVDETRHLEAEVQVRADHPDAGEADPDDPNWATPSSAPRARPQVPYRYGTSPTRRAQAANFMFRSLSLLGGDLKAAWADFLVITEESIGPLR